LNFVIKISGISEVKELHVWKLSSDNLIATVHVKCNYSYTFMEIATRINSLFNEKGIKSATIQPEFIDVNLSTFFY
jgi:Co/Zn/Cd efflux system component